jgi:cytochrome P450 monooxygenase
MDTFESDWKRFNFFMMRESEAVSLCMAPPSKLTVRNLIPEQKGLPCPVREMYQDVLAGTITEANWLQTIDEILFTNLDVTSAILAFLLINLSINQPVQKELRDEIVQNIGKAAAGVVDSNGDTDSLEAYIRKTDTLLEYTCIESGRLCPAVWFTLPEYAGADLDIGGYRVPAGTSCIIDWARLNTESRLWNPEVNNSTKEQQLGSEAAVTGQMFYPQRFWGMSPTTYRWSMLRFGLGGRQCIGKNFAARIMKQFLVEVLTRYRVELDGERPVKQWGTINVELREDRFTVMPKQNVRFVRI